MGRIGKVGVAALWASIGLLAACGGEVDGGEGHLEPAETGAVEVELETSLSLVEAKLVLLAQGGEPIELLLEEAQGRWSGRRDGLTPGSYEARAILDEGNGWTPGERTLPLEIRSGATRTLRLIFDPIAGWSDSLAPTITHHILTTSNEEATTVELRFEAQASEAGAGGPLAWVLTVYSPALCRDAATWTSEAGGEGPRIEGMMEDDGSVTAHLEIGRAQGLERCQVHLEVKDADGAKARLELQVSARPIDLTIEE